MPAAVAASGLVKRFDQVTALDGLDLEIREGEAFGLLGPNGAGKTTLVRILVTLLRPDAGSALVAGCDALADPGGVRERIGYVPQEISTDRSLTARESLRLFADLHHLSPARRAQRVEALLSLTGLAPAADQVARGYSGGMKKKLDLACGLLHEPKVLFLDEPTLGLDVAARRAIWDYLDGLRAGGTTLVLCTNIMEEADRLCDRLAILDRGRVAALGEPEALRADLGGDIVTVEPLDGAGGGADRLEALLRGLPFVRRTTREGARIHAFVERHETAMPAVIEAAVTAGVPLRAASFSRPGLEEVFLSHTGRSWTADDAAVRPKAARA